MHFAISREIEFIGSESIRQAIYEFTTVKSLGSLV